MITDLGARIPHLFAPGANEQWLQDGHRRGLLIELLLGMPSSRDERAMIGALVDAIWSELCQGRKVGADALEELKDVCYGVIGVGQGVLKPGMPKAQ